MLRLFLRFLTDTQVQKRYVSAGGLVGGTASYFSRMSVRGGFEGARLRWARWEIEYARRGYRTIPLMDFVNYGRYGVQLTGVGVKRESQEQIVFHAQYPK